VTSHTHEKYIITDIDGTVVPHPYHSGLTQSERNPYITKLLHLMRNHHVACVTGRTLHGWKRLWTDSGNDPHLPRLMGLSFGAEVYFHGKALPVTPNSHELQQATHELRAALDAIPEFRNQADTAVTMSKGQLQGYSIEVKPRIVQIDWNFATESMNLRFAEQVFHTLNPHLARKAALRCQVFHRRIDILSDGFVPKAELAHHVADWVQNTRLAPVDSRGQLPECIVLGDELYDDYLFQSIKTLKPKVFGHVRCIGVRNGNTALFQHADEVVESPKEAWDLIDIELKGSR
jgi:hydroxymethylpyrimidine pyrophosphatase-like HAD family hydrolase